MSPAPVITAQLGEDQPSPPPRPAVAPEVTPAWPGFEHQGPRPDHRISADPGDPSPIGHRETPFVPTDSPLVPGGFGIVP